MPTKFEIDEQIALEREQIRQGLQQLRSNTSNLEEKVMQVLQSTGWLLLSELIPRVVDRIKSTKLTDKQRSCWREL